MKQIKASAALLAVLALLWIAYALPAVLLTAELAPTAMAAAATGLRADAALVPGAAAWGNRPSPAFAERLDAAFWLWRSGRVARIVLTGGAGSEGALSEATVGAYYLEQLGVPRGDLILEQASRDTAGNLALSQPLLARAGIRRIAVVSHGFHLYRTGLMARDLGLEPVPVAVPSRWLNIPYFTAREVLALVPYWAWERWQLRGYGPGAVLLADLALGGGAVLLAQGLYALWLLRRLGRVGPLGGERRLGRVGPLGGEPPAGVSVILPIKGLDPGAVDHYRHWLAQDPGLPREVIFSLQDPEDPALPVIQGLVAGLPPAVARVVVNPVREGLHGKASNLWYGVRESRYPLLVMADSDVDPPPGLLGRLLAPLAESRVGLVACLPLGVRARGFWGWLNALGINATLGLHWAPAQELGLGLGAPGACVAIPRSVLERIGGIEAIGSYVAEDARLAMLVARAGYRVWLGPAVPLEVGESGRAAVLSLLSRGAFMLKYMYPWPLRVGMTAVILGPYLMLAGGLLAGNGLVPGSALIFLLARWGTALAYHAAANPRQWGAGLLAPLLEGIGLSVALRVLGSNVVQWRGLRYRVGPGGRLHRLS